MEVDWVFGFLDDNYGMGCFFLGLSGRYAIRNRRVSYGENCNTYDSFYFNSMFNETRIVGKDVWLLAVQRLHKKKNHYVY